MFNRISTGFFFIFLSVITLTLQKIPSSGSEENLDLGEGWSEWSEWSPCSRTCGGGVAVQSRRCRNWQGCKGNSVRYNLCKDVPCPNGSLDFLSMQCSEHDYTDNDRGQHNWEPAPGGDLCVLTCKVKGTNDPPVVLSPRVRDGTRCGQNHEGMCIHGQCQTIGCDSVLGSKLTLDVCGVCGGNGESCGANSIRWRRKTDGPCSATCGGGFKILSAKCENISTGEEVSHTMCRRLRGPPNIISTCGESPCPASWQTGEWTECSASCGQGYQVREFFCTENKNGVVIRVAEHYCTESRPLHRRLCGGECPRWSEGVWSQCSVTCGDGVQRRNVTCTNFDGEVSSLCNFSQRPTSTRPCRTGVKCKLFGPDWLQDSMEDQSSLFPPLREETIMQEEDRVPSEPTFIAGPWSSCSASCGEGYRIRNVTCKIYLEFSKTVPILPDAQCPGRVPVKAKRCFLKHCPGLDPRNEFINQSQGEDPNLATKTPFSSFEDPEPLLSERKKGVLIPMRFHSAESPSVIADDSQTLDIGSPNSEESLDTILYPMISKTSLNGYIYHNEILHDANYIWKEDGFTNCSQPCLGGVQELKYNCVDLKHNSRKVANHMCNPKEKPDSITKTCNDHPCPPRWDVSEFDKCSKSCGGGINRRRVVCIHEMTRSSSGKMPVSNHLCPQPPPYAQKYCNMEPCPARWITGKWSRCSKDCDNGIKTREIRCVRKQAFSKQVTSLPPQLCPKIKPATKRRCIRRSCYKKKMAGKKGPVIRAQVFQNYRQKKYMKTVILKVGGKASVFHGAKIKVKCPTRRFNRKDISWWRNGVLLGPHTKRLDRIKVTKKGVLKINRIEYTDAGIYFCKAGPKEANLTLRVQPLPASFASSEEAPRPPQSHIRNYSNKWKLGSNDIYFHSLEERMPIQVNQGIKDKQGLSSPKQNSYGRNPFDRIASMPADVMATSGPQGIQDHVKLNLHTVEESSSETPLRPFIYGKVSESGVPAGRVEPRRGIGLLSEKVAQSRALDRMRDGGSLEVHEGQDSLGPAGQHIYGVIQNRTEIAQVNSEERFHFATVRETDTKNSGQFPNSQNKNVSNTSMQSNSMKGLGDLLYKMPIMGDSYRGILPPDGIPQIIGKGGRENLEFEWKISNWTACTQTCSFTGSSGGYQYRTAECIIHVDDSSNRVDDALCMDAGLATPPTHQRCGFEECPQWKVEDWSACENSRCYTLHYALQKRNVACALFNGSSTSEGLCDKISKPRHKRECFNRQCVGVWRTEDWSKCTAPCGGQGYRTRLLQCVWNGTKKSAGNACREKPRPEVVRWCDGPPCSKKGKARKKDDQTCQDESRYCRIVVRLNMCQHYHHKCCKSCQ